MSSQAVDERDYFNAFVELAGHHHSTPTVVRAPDLAEDGCCWTGAWEEAQKNGGLYVEGMCLRNGNEIIRAHAWVERDGVIVECTWGYENVSEYKGFGMSARVEGSTDRESTEAFTPFGERFAVIEWLVVNAGLPPRSTSAPRRSDVTTSKDHSPHPPGDAMTILAIITDQGTACADALCPLSRGPHCPAPGRTLRRGGAGRDRGPLAGGLRQPGGLLCHLWGDVVTTAVA